MDDMLDMLLDGVTEPRLKLICGDEARDLMVLLGVLDDHAPRGGPPCRRGDALPPRLPAGLNPGRYGAFS
ncbi:hypothetical protein [Streptomyces sp. NBC_01565]|uniref:hypothetical protein n=1 Tax=unclassified Streptomyces TaxID=2593676 RepID=UPI002250D827|nr:hypothetical protein [Streptomyces sp. NBC_01565]MCX4546983.1 hypothetical protein [Streptomyces sp. NBC_01565]